MVAELEHAAVARLDTELALSRAALAAGGDAAKEKDILQTWTDYYDRSLGTLSDVETSGSSRETIAAITIARARVLAAGASRVSQIR
jgi:aminopeptidase YwaD